MIVNCLFTPHHDLPIQQREARKYFGCSTLNGLELENLGGQVTRYFHWKKKLVDVSNAHTVDM